ncbi:unnamed protein product [Rhizophagus irregularis]|nr:unnamed protein product [Rhizophagus irregularis]
MSSQDFDKEQGILSTTATISTPNSISVAVTTSTISTISTSTISMAATTSISMASTTSTTSTTFNGRNNFNNLNLNGRNTSIAIRVSSPLPQSSLYRLSSPQIGQEEIDEMLKKKELRT